MLIDDIEESDRDRIYALVRDLEMIAAEIKDLEKAEQELREKLMAELTNNSLDFVRGTFSEIRYIKPSKSIRLDSKKLQDEHPDIYEKYSVESERKGYLNVKILK